MTKKKPPQKSAPKKKAKAGPRLPTEERRKKFVDAYCGEAMGNATVAARIAGYGNNPESHAASGSRLLRDVQVAAEIRKREEETRSKARMTREQLLGHIEKAILGEEFPQTFVTGIGLEKDDASAPWPTRAKLMETLAKMNGWTLEKVEVKSSFSLLDIVNAAGSTEH